MGLFDRITGRQGPPPGTATRTADEVLGALLALNGPDVPYLVRQDGNGEADLLAEWRLTEPVWYSHFARTRIDRTLQVLMRLDADDHEVRTVDKQWTVTWTQGVPYLSVAKEFQRGVVKQASWQKTIGVGDDGNLPTTPVFDFSSEQLKKPLRETVLRGGWAWKPVVFGRL